MAAGRRFVRTPGFTRFAAACAALTLATLSCRDEPTGPAGPLLLEPGQTATFHATVGSRLKPSPTFVIRDANGQPLAGIPVTITVSEGGGELRNAPRRTGAGPIPVGDWILGGTVGRHALTVRAGSLQPLVIEVMAAPASPAAIVVTGRGQRALAGDALPQPIQFRVQDRFGNGVAGVSLSLSVVSGGGAVTPANVTTDAAGIARIDGWQLGRHGGAQQIAATGMGLLATVNAEIQSDYTPEVRFYGDPPPEEIQAMFRSAANRIRASVVGDTPDVPLYGFDLSRCGVQSPPLTETIDDVVIYATITKIDGPGRVLGSAGPCISRSQSRFAVIGVIRFDSDDLDELRSRGRFEDVILHELLHIVGVGTLWRAKQLLLAGGTADPRFGGLGAASRCVAAGGVDLCGQGTVPVENTGSTGTADVHWRETTFDDELMTGFAEDGPMPLSAMTLASIEDLGLAVNYRAADPYTLPAPTASAVHSGAAAVAPAWEVVLAPRFEVTSSGWVRPLKPPP